MNRTPDVELVLRDYLADDGLTAPDFILEAVGARISRQRQRRAWPFQWRTNVTTPIKLAAGLAAAIVVAVVGYGLLPRASGPGGPSTTPTVSASPTAAATAAGPVALPDGTLTAGRYRMDLSFIDPGLSVDAELPAGWSGHSELPGVTSPAGNNEGILISFMETDGLFSDACQWDLNGTGSADQAGDVEVGPTVDDLVAALKANTSYTSSTPSPVTFGPFRGQELELQLPGIDVITSCDERRGERTGDFFVFPNGFYAQGSNSRWQLSIVDVDGIRLIIMVSIAENTPQADVTTAEAIVDSFEIAP